MTNVFLFGLCFCFKTGSFIKLSVLFEVDWPASKALGIDLSAQGWSYTGVLYLALHGN